MIGRRIFVGGALATPALGFAQSGFPDRPLRLVIPFAPGGGTDAFARRIATRLGQELGQNVVPDNRAGASGAIGMADVLRARPDGYTLVFAGASTHSLYPLVVARPQYDPLVDFSPVALVGANSVCVIARSDVATSLTQLVALAKARPGQLRFANPGTGTYVHMVGEYLAYRARLEWLAVPYRGNGQAMIDMLAGQVDAGTDTVITSLPHHREGKVRILAVTSAARSPLLPEVPTVAEALNLPGFEAVLWSMLAVRAGTPPDLVRQLHDATLRALADRTFRDDLSQGGIEASPPLSPAQVQDFIRAETEKWRPIVAATGVRLD
jgi:tripartite-type tricarboxylate transporter receptor subunit TctC